MDFSETWTIDDHRPASSSFRTSLELCAKICAASLPTFIFRRANQASEPDDKVGLIHTRSIPITCCSDPGLAICQLDSSHFRTMPSWLHMADGLLLQLLYTFTVAFALNSMYDVGPQLEADFLGAELPQCCTIARDLVNPRSANWASGMPFEVQESTGNLHWSFLFENHSPNAKWSDFESALGSTCNLGIQLIRSTLLRDSLSIKKHRAETCWAR